MRTLVAALGLCLLALPAEAQRWFPSAGTQPYRYEISRNVAGSLAQHYRVDFDLVSDGAGGLVAIVRGFEHAEDAGWGDEPIDAACRAAMHAGPGEVARVPLLPANTGLEAAFLPTCAPQELFLALTDILNVALIQSPHFGIEALSAVGDSRRFAGFDTHFARGSLAADSSTPGGTIRFVEATGTRATID